MKDGNVFRWWHAALLTALVVSVLFPIVIYFVEWRLPPEPIPIDQAGLPDFIERWIDNAAPLEVGARENRALAAQEAMASAAWWMIAVTLLSVIAAFFAAFYLIRQVKAAEDGNRIAREQNALVNRAWIAIRHVGPAQPLISDKGEEIRFVFQFKNIGNTPARDFSFSLQGVVAAEPILGEIEPVGQRPTLTVPPGDPFLGSETVGPYPKGVLELISNGQALLRVRAHARYRVFSDDKWHETTLSGIYDWEKKDLRLDNVGLEMS